MINFIEKIIKNQQFGGVLLICCTIISIGLSNSDILPDYFSFWHFKIANHPLEYWINDGLMTIFFLSIGLELEREIINGELATVKKASLPIIAALGGMIIPAILFLLLNSGTTFQSGFGIPMATDIAFALAILSLLGKNVPPNLKLFLTALAVIDDIGAILIIALFYTKTLILMNLFISLGIFLLLLILRYLKVKNLLIYLFGGIFMWYFMLNSGIHATITGVLLAFAIPFDKGNEISPSFRLQEILHLPVTFIILPLFALANTAFIFQTGWENSLLETYTLGILNGLVIGKPIGIFLFSFLAVKFKICLLPEGLNWKSILGAGMLGGIGFTMSIFITLLAFRDQNQIDSSKIMILFSSLLAGIFGYFFLKAILNKKTNFNV